MTLTSRLKYYENSVALCSDNPENIIIWLCSNGNAKKIIAHYDGKINEEVIINKININNPSFYALPMDAVDDFDFHYPEYSMEIFKYFKDNEIYWKSE